MSQATAIVAAVIVAFLVWITARKELPIYMGFFGVGAGAISGSSGLITGAGGFQVTPKMDTGNVTLNTILYGNPLTGVANSFQEYYGNPSNFDSDVMQNPAG